jgi:hypothetical protein
MVFILSLVIYIDCHIHTNVLRKGDKTHMRRKNKKPAAASIWNITTLATFLTTSLKNVQI